jgi:hypothetical protein
MGKKHTRDFKTEGVEIYIIWRDLPDIFLSRIRQKAHSPSWIQKKVSGHTEARIANR